VSYQDTIRALREERFELRDKLARVEKALEALEGLTPRASRTPTGRKVHQQPTHEEGLRRRRVLSDAIRAWQQDPDDVPLNVDYVMAASEEPERLRDAYRSLMTQYAREGKLVRLTHGTRTEQGTYRVPAEVEHA